MIKVRVYEVARELGLDNRELVSKIASLGIQVRNHMSALEPAEVERIKRALDKDKQANVVEERIRPTVVRRRAVGGPPAPAGGRHDDIAGPATASYEDEEPAPRPAPAARAPAPRAPEPAPQPQVQPPAPAAAPAPEPMAAQPAPAPREQPAAAAPAPAPAAESPRAPAPVAAQPSPPPAPEPQVEAAPAPAPTPTPAPRATPPAQRVMEAREPSHEDVMTARPAPVRQQNVMRRPESRTGSQVQVSDRRGSQPPPASERLGHAHLPPGVVARGNTVAPSAPRLSSEAVSRIVAQHNPPAPPPGMAGAPLTPRRRELGRAALGAPGRTQVRQGRPGRARKLAPGRKAGSTQITTPGAQKRVIRIEDQISLQMLAQRMSLKATEVLMKLVQLGMTGVNINSKLDADTAKILASEFGYEVENVAVSTADMITAARGEIDEQAVDRQHRPPIVTVMGHVDHGKTSLLDKIRTARVAAREAGGITQHIGAYRVETEKGTIVFLDTPGHEAFTAMRARGAEATDIVILVVAADDGVMPQTREAINHAKAASVPIVVAVNKIDKDTARPDVVMRDLANEGLQSEEWGGEVQFQNVSAHTGEGIPELLEKLLLQAELLELDANPKVPAEGVVLEAYLDKGRGPVANVLVRNGTLKVGDLVVAGQAWGKVKAMTDDRGRQIREAAPATPVEILGLSEVPSAGERFYVVTDAKKAQEISDIAKRAESAAMPSQHRMGLDQIHQMMQSGDMHELKLIIKADVQGSIEAIVKALTDLSTDKVKVTVIHTGVGGITEGDVMLATASNCIVIGFNVRPTGKAADVAKSEGVDLRLYRVIYDAVEEVKKAMTGMLAPRLVEKALGKAEVRQVMVIPKLGAIAGCYVTDGKIVRSGKARVVRDSAMVWEGGIKGLRRFKDDVRDVAAGYECGVALDGFNDLKERDMIECFEMESVAAQL
jgi:translation initiation factor IF-2